MEIDGTTGRWKRSGSAAVSMSRCRLRAVRGQHGLLLCRASPHRDNEGWSAGKDVQSSLTVCVPSELSPVSSVTIQLLWPPLAPPLSSWSLSQPVTHSSLPRTHKHMDSCMQVQMHKYVLDHANILGGHLLKLCDMRSGAKKRCGVWEKNKAKLLFNI